MISKEYQIRTYFVFVFSFLLMGSGISQNHEVTASSTYEGVNKVVGAESIFSPEKTRVVLDEIQRRTFLYFWDDNYEAGGDVNSGMSYEGSKRRNNLTTGGSGFGMMTWIAAVERGWISREQAVSRMVKLVRFLGKADRFHGVWSHWMIPNSGKAKAFGGRLGGDLVETSFMLSGLLMAREYFNKNTKQEKEVRDSVNSFYRAVEWDFFTNGENCLYWNYSVNKTENNGFQLKVRGWNEALITYILALGSPTHPISKKVYQVGWTHKGKISKDDRIVLGYPLRLGRGYGGPMFLSHYSHLGLDPRQMEDQYTNYWMQAVNHTMINREYCVNKAPKEYGYSVNEWGLTACYGPNIEGYKYKARNPLNDDGTIAPTAALGSMPYTPFYSMQVLMHLFGNVADTYGRYGFFDSYNKDKNWYSNKGLAIDQGPIAVMIENFRSGLFWKLLMKVPEIERGLSRAGINKPKYENGFHLAIADVESGCYDIMMHPDLGKYRLDFYLQNSQQVSFYLLNDEGKLVRELISKRRFSKGEHNLEFDADKIVPGSIGYVSMKMENREKNLKIRFH